MNNENEKMLKIVNISLEKLYQEDKYLFECDVKEENIRAEFKNGILKIEIPKKEEQEKLNEPKHIAIE